MDSRFPGNDEFVLVRAHLFTFETGHMVYTNDCRFRGNDEFVLVRAHLFTFETRHMVYTNDCRFRGNDEFVLVRAHCLHSKPGTWFTPTIAAFAEMTN